MSKISEERSEIASARNFIVLVGAGSGTRFGASVPKAFCRIDNRSLLALSAQAALSVSGLCGLVCVVPADWEAQARAELLPLSDGISVAFVRGGETRHHSVANGVAKLKSDFQLGLDDLIGIHDAARCLVTTEIFERCFAAARRSGAATAASPVRDTLKNVSNEIVLADGSVSRDGLYGMQTPQIFRYDLLERGMRSAAAIEATDEVSLVQKLAPVSIVETSFVNFKVTYPGDLEIAATLLKARS